MFSGWSGHHILDPIDIQDRFSTEDGLGSIGSVNTEPTEEAILKFNRIKYVLDLLPPAEADALDLCYLRGIVQTVVAEIFGVSQPTISYRLNKAIDRIQFILDMPSIPETKMRRDLSEGLPDPLDVSIMIYMFRVACQTETARLINQEFGSARTQGFVRHRFIKAIQRLHSAGLTYYGELFDTIQSNLNILRAVSRPHGKADPADRPERVGSIECLLPPLNRGNGSSLE